MKTTDTRLSRLEARVPTPPSAVQDQDEVRQQMIADVAHLLATGALRRAPDGPRSDTPTRRALLADLEVNDGN